jgi:hypothetical protein
MKTTIQLIFIICILYSTTLTAQRFQGAIIAGLSTNQIDGDEQSGYNKPGIYSGVSVETNFNKLLGIKTELFYINKGAKKVVDGIEVFKTTLHYIEQPFLIIIKPLQKVQFDVGIAGSYLIGSKLIEYGEVVDKSLYDLHNFDFSVKIAGFYYFNSHTGFSTSFNYSLIPVKKEPNWFPNNLCFGLIYKFK